MFSETIHSYRDLCTNMQAWANLTSILNGKGCKRLANITFEMMHMGLVLKPEEVRPEAETFAQALTEILKPYSIELERAHQAGGDALKNVPMPGIETDLRLLPGFNLMDICEGKQAVPALIQTQEIVVTNIHCPSCGHQAVESAADLRWKVGETWDCPNPECWVQLTVGTIDAADNPSRLELYVMEDEPPDGDDMPHNENK